MRALFTPFRAVASIKERKVNVVPRFELDGDVWQVVQTGKQLEITSGGKTAVRKFVTVEQAAAQLDKLVDEKRRAGYVLVGDPRHPELEAAITDAPESPASYSVYADWLQSLGDPRGTLIALQLAAEAQPGKLGSAWAAELDRHREYLLGPLAPHAVREGDVDVFEWRFGYIHRAYLRDARASVLSPLLAHPSGRFLVELALVTDEQRHIDTLAQHAPASLRGLRIATSGRLDLRALWPVVPRLRRLSLSGRALVLGELELPRLERLHLADSQLSSANARMVARMPWPHLAQLKIDFGQGVLTGNASVDEVLDLLNRHDLPALTHVAILHTRQISDLVKDLPASAVASQLEVLDLSFSHMMDNHALLLAGQRAKFPRLTHLDVSHNRLTPRGVEALQPLARTVRAVSQRPD